MEEDFFYCVLENTGSKEHGLTKTVMFFNNKEFRDSSFEEELKNSIVYNFIKLKIPKNICKQYFEVEPC